MKKILGLFLLGATAVFGLTVNDLKMSQATNASPPAYTDRIFSPVASGLVGTDSSSRPQGVVIGANLTLTGNVLSATSSGGSVNWGSIGGVLANQSDLVAALAAKQDSLTFSTGLTNTSGTITVNATQLISRLSNLTTNGFVKTGSANGTLSIDTSTYLTHNQTISFTPDPTGDVGGGSSGQTSLAPLMVVTGANGIPFASLTTGVMKVTNGTGVISTGGTAISSGLTMATARLLGRSTASSGAIEEITVGSGLSLSGGSLTATGGGGTGTVTTVSVVTANGVSGSVANATTTPAITLTLGAITPSTVNALTLASQTVGFTIAGGTGSRTLTVSGNANVSGTNTGDQTTITGNAGTATALQTARAINGVDFDGTTPITVTAAAGTLTGTTLNNTVTTSSLTSVAVITTGAWQGSVVTGTYGGTGVNNSTSTITIGGNLAFSGAFATTFTVSAATAVTLPTTGTLATLGNNETFTGIKTFTPTLRTSGSASYLTVNMPADTTLATTAESIGVNFAAGTRQWATGTVALQREHVFGANTITAVGASTFTLAVNVDIADPVAGTNATLTAKYGLRAANALFTTSATVGVASSATGVLKFIGTTSGIVTLSVADAAGTNTFKLPATAGSNTNVLATDGSGNLFWQASSGGSGTINSGTATNFTYYAGTGTTVDGTPTMTVTSAGRLSMQPTAVSSGVVPFLTIQTPSDTVLTAGTEAIGLSYLGATRQHGSNTAIGNQRDVVFAATTHGFVSATGTITNAATVAIVAAPVVGTNAAITNAAALWLQAGDFMMGSGVAGVSLAKFSQSSGLLTVSSVGGMNLRPSLGSGGILSIAGSSQDIVFSDSTSTTTWQGPGTTGQGFYQQRAGTSYYYNLSVAASPAAGYWLAEAAGSYGALTATPSGRPFTFGVYTYGGSTWVNTSYVQMRTSQLQSESARGTAIWFTTTANGATSLRVSMIMDQDGTCLAFVPTGGLGYGVGAGGAVTQASSRTTGVTLSTVSGAITLVSAAGSATAQTFTVTNTACAALDTVIVSQTSGTDLYEIFVTNVGAGSFKITFFTTGGTTTEQPVFHFNIIKGVSS